jgi:hypothetical protein
MHVTSLSAALEELDRGEVRLIMMSLSLSDAAGLPALARMRASARGVPIVVLGARYDEETAMRAVREGAEDYLVKGDVSEQAMLRIVRYTAERVRVERELRESEARYRRLAENAPDIIFRYELKPRRGVAYVNSAVTQTLGYTPGEIYQDHTLLARILDPDEHSALKSALMTRDAVGPVVVPLQHRDGRLLWAEQRLVALHDEDGNVVAVEGIIRDITERRLIEANLARAEKLNSLGVMASGVAHQMNNVLSTVMSHADFLRQRTQDPAMRHDLDLIIRAAEDGAASVRRIQGFARSDPIERPEPVNLVGIVNEAAEATAPRWRDQSEREGRSITLSVDATPPVWINGVQSELREALMNLIFNAVDALPDGGSISVQCEQSDDQVRLRVVDNGIGMSEEVQRHALDPFFTTKSFGEGMGLGLALTNRIIGRHGGSIDIQSGPGVGAAFEIMLPAGRPPDAEPSAPIVVTMAPLRVLVVDDDPVQARQLGRLLTLDGHCVLVSSDGPDALRTLSSQSFDLVITDLGMPGVTGWEVAREAKVRHPEVRVGLVTGWGNEVGEAEAACRGVDFIVTKPYRIVRLQEAISAAMGWPR